MAQTSTLNVLSVVPMDITSNVIDNYSNFPSTLLLNGNCNNISDLIMLSSSSSEKRDEYINNDTVVGVEHSVAVPIISVYQNNSSMDSILTKVNNDACLLSATLGHNNSNLLSTFSSSAAHRISKEIESSTLVDKKSIKTSIDRNKEALKVKLMTRRPIQQLVEQGILPPLKTNPQIYARKSRLEKVKMGDFLKHKIQQRPDRQQLISQHILLDTIVDPGIHEKQQQLKKCRIADSLNEKISHRPGPLELVQGNILHVDAALEQAVKEGKVQFKPTSAGLTHKNMTCMALSATGSLASDDETSQSSLILADNASSCSSPGALSSFSNSSGVGSPIHSSPSTIVTSSLSAPNSVMGNASNGNSSGNFLKNTCNGEITSCTNESGTAHVKHRPKSNKRSLKSVKSSLMTTSSGGNNGKNLKSSSFKFHEYKGPTRKSALLGNANSNFSTTDTPLTVQTNCVEACSPLSVGSNASSNGSDLKENSILAINSKYADIFKCNGNEETRYDILLQQQQLLLQWQLELQQKYPNSNIHLMPVATSQNSDGTFTVSSVPPPIAFDQNSAALTNIGPNINSPFNTLSSSTLSSIFQQHKNSFENGKEQQTAIPSELTNSELNVFNSAQCDSTVLDVSCSGSTLSSQRMPNGFNIPLLECNTTLPSFTFNPVNSTSFSQLIKHSSFSTTSTTNNVNFGNDTSNLDVGCSGGQFSSTSMSDVIMEPSNNDLISNTSSSNGDCEKHKKVFAKSQTGQDANSGRSSPNHQKQVDSLPVFSSYSKQIIAKLEDMRVSDLKAECKKRNLPVSGPKPNLLERLKPFEDLIIATHHVSQNTASDQNVSKPDDSINTAATSLPSIVNMTPFLSPVPSNGITSNGIDFDSFMDDTSCSTPPARIDTLKSQESNKSGFIDMICFGDSGVVPAGSKLANENVQQSLVCADSAIQNNQSSASMALTSGITSYGTRSAHHCFSSSEGALKLNDDRTNCDLTGSVENSLSKGAQEKRSNSSSTKLQSIPSISVNYCNDSGSNVVEQPEIALNTTTLSQHEQLLRKQQKRIEVLQRELQRSQDQLRRQQQLIVTAKQLQQNEVESTNIEGKSNVLNDATVGTTADSCEKHLQDAVSSTVSRVAENQNKLSRCDMKYLQKMHMQLFLQHKLQQQNFQKQLAAQEKLAITHQRIKENFMHEQALSEVGLLLKRDVKSAVALLALLRKLSDKTTVESVLDLPSDNHNVDSLSVASNSSGYVSGNSSRKNSGSSGNIAVTLNNTCSRSRSGISVNSNSRKQIIKSSSLPTSPHKPKSVNHQNTRRGGEQSRPVGDMEDIFNTVLTYAAEATKEPTAIEGESCLSENCSDFTNPRNCYDQPIDHALHVLNEHIPPASVDCGKLPSYEQLTQSLTHQGINSKNTSNFLREDALFDQVQINVGSSECYNGSASTYGNGYSRSEEVFDDLLEILKSNEGIQHALNDFEMQSSQNLQDCDTNGLFPIGFAGGDTPNFHYQSIHPNDAMNWVPSTQSMSFNGNISESPVVSRNDNMNLHCLFDDVLPTSISHNNSLETEQMEWLDLILPSPSSAENLPSNPPSDSSGTGLFLSAPNVSDMSTSSQPSSLLYSYNPLLAASDLSSCMSESTRSETLDLLSLVEEIKKESCALQVAAGGGILA